jgi:soluble lytic murein transglycosylase
VTRASVVQLKAVLAVAVAVSACSVAPVPHRNDAHEQTLDQAFALAPTDPSRAAALFADAGPGTALEYARMASWADCLERLDASPESWRRYLEDSPPPALANRARLALVRALADAGEIGAVVDERSLLPTELQATADELLLAGGDPTIRLEAAHRLAVTAPRRLDSHDRALDREISAGLEPLDRLDRVRAWRRDGAPSRAATELRSVRWQGDMEAERRRELARSELAAGSPRAALRALPSGSDAEASDLVLRAQAHRNRAWGLFPNRQAEAVFRDCSTNAERALDRGATEASKLEALRLKLECTTEAGDLETAFDSWRQLEAARWRDPRREWLGRRLGVALVHRGNAREEIRALARSMPGQRRCLRYWLARSSPQGVPELQSLAGVGIADLYGVWSRDTLHLPPQQEVQLGSPVLAGQPPSSVRRLIEVGAESAAVGQWRRIRRQRATTADEAVAAAELAARRGLPFDTIRWLRAGFPELGTVNMAAAAENAVLAYLPLRWQEALIEASRESGVDPWLIAAIARQESTFAAHAVSPRGAVGVLQLVPSTARGHARALGLGSSPDLRNPEINIRLGARELGYLMRRFGALEPALAAYNAGETRVRGWWRRRSDPQRFTEDIPVPETYNYVRRVVYLSEAYRLAHRETWGGSQ